ncbi:phage major capsid protein [Clostridium perfringens]|nr:phage major capsid protein [Clostridium perfringens]
MSLKALKEKRNGLLNDLESMISGLESESEIRALSEDEMESFNAKKKEIESLDATISLIEESRAREAGKLEELQEERNNDDMERRALDKFFRGQDLVGEERAMLASSNTALMPLEISKTILKKLEEFCPVLEKAKRFNSKGTLRLILESDYKEAGITAENTAFKDADVSFKTVELKAYKITAQVKATFELLQNSEIDLSNYLLDVIVRRLSKELNKLFITGDGTNKPQGLIKATTEVEYAGAKPTIQDFIKLQTSLHPAYLDGAVWIVNRATFQEMASLLDGANRPYMTSNVIKDRIAYYLLGLEIIIDTNVEADKVILANIGEAYAINMLQDITVRHLLETGFTSGLEIYAGYVMADGRIVNEDAILIGKPQGGLYSLEAKEEDEPAPSKATGKAKK